MNSFALGSLSRETYNALCLKAYQASTSCQIWPTWLLDSNSLIDMHSPYKANNSSQSHLLNASWTHNPTLLSRCFSSSKRDNCSWTSSQPLLSSSPSNEFMNFTAESASSFPSIEILSWVLFFTLNSSLRWLNPLPKYFFSFKWAFNNLMYFAGMSMLELKTFYEELCICAFIYQAH